MANTSIGVSRIHTRKIDVNGLPAALPTLSAYKVVGMTFAGVSEGT